MNDVVFRATIFELLWILFAVPGIFYCWRIQARWKRNYRNGQRFGIGEEALSIAHQYEVTWSALTWFFVIFLIVGMALAAVNAASPPEQRFVASAVLGAGFFIIEIAGMVGAYFYDRQEQKRWQRYLAAAQLDALQEKEGQGHV